MADLVGGPDRPHRSEPAVNFTLRDLLAFLAYLGMVATGVVACLSAVGAVHLH